ncbi:hypothetical protein CR203_17860 [Salipaludibacillus neizhouensis]|uniref:Uncharacterized protein n=1 Tax=Salipaludibacillus neizhouensis TaxID=885475 RepID=A0A3A9K0N0_9BACI|nr:hypothetical protein [Salipaludibacillus neizhouensis]RKL65939.1 hypothetical protein CR203_17860 [Salipaludibacillus neizhouensis]
MRKIKQHHMYRKMQRNMGRKRTHWRFQYIVDGFFQVVLLLIIFQFIRTLLLPTTFDVIFLGILTVIYLFHYFK